MDAERTAPEIAREAVALIGQLYAVEKQTKDLSVAERPFTSEKDLNFKLCRAPTPD